MPEFSEYTYQYHWPHVSNYPAKPPPSNTASLLLSATAECWRRTSAGPISSPPQSDGSAATCAVPIGSAPTLQRRGRIPSLLRSLKQSKLAISGKRHWIQPAKICNFYFRHVHVRKKWRQKKNTLSSSVAYLTADQSNSSQISDTGGQCVFLLPITFKLSNTEQK